MSDRVQRGMSEEAIEAFVKSARLPVLKTLECATGYWLMINEADRDKYKYSFEDPVWSGVHNFHYAVKKEIDWRVSGEAARIECKKYGGCDTKHPEKQQSWWGFWCRYLRSI